MTELPVPNRGRFLLPRLIGILFGSLWGVIAALSLPLRDRPLAFTVIVLITLGCLVRVSMKPPAPTPGPSLFRRKAYLIAVGAEVIAIYIASLALPRVGGQQYLFSAVGIIVGLHFIGLWRASGSRYFLMISASMCLVSALSMLVPFNWMTCNPRYIFLGIANAVILWLGATEGR